MRRWTQAHAAAEVLGEWLQNKAGRRWSVSLLATPYPTSLATPHHGGAAGQRRSQWTAATASSTDALPRGGFTSLGAHTLTADAQDSSSIHVDRAAANHDANAAQPSNPDSRWLPGSALVRFGRDLTDEARRGLLDPVIGREDVIMRATQVLMRRTKNNPCLIGDAGVGKTAVAEGVAQLMVSPAAPPGLAGRRLISLDVTALVAGTAYRGEFEGRLRALLSDVAATCGAVVLFIDELHMLVRAGGSEGGLDAGNILKPALARGGLLQCIGATTVEEFRQHIEPDAAFARRWQPILVEEPSLEVAEACLRGLAPRYEQHHGVTFSPAALSAAVRCAKRYITDRRLPDSAIDLMDEAAASVVLRRCGTAVAAAAAGGSSVQASCSLSASDSASRDGASIALAGQQGGSCSAGSEQAGAPDLNPSSSEAATPTWRSWVQRQGWRGPTEARHQQLLEWFGAAPTHPLSGPAGHQQVVAERVWRHAQLFEPSTAASRGRGAATLTPRTEPRHPAVAGGATQPPVVAGLQGLELSPHWLMQAKSCPQCGHTCEPSLAGEGRDWLRLRCWSCGTRFLNIPQERLQLGATVLMQHWPQSPQPPPPPPQPHHHLQEQPQPPLSASQPTVGADGRCSQAGGRCGSDSCSSATGAAAVSATVHPGQASQWPPLLVDEPDVLQVVAEATGVPVAKLSQAAVGALAQVEDAIGAAVVGQRPAIDTVCGTLRVWRLGLAPASGRPAASFVFLGPPGVGKKTLCKEVARQLLHDERALIHLQMSEFCERASLSRLVGAPPGYIGHDRASGTLVDSLRRRPHCLLLFEAIDAAHPEVQDVLCRLVQTGRLSDAAGRTASLDSVIIVFTLSPVLAARLAGDAARASGALPGLPPAVGQLLGWVDTVVPFVQLDEHSLQGVVRLQLDAADAHLSHTLGIRLTADGEACAWLAQRGASQALGAAPLQGVLRRHVLLPLAELLGAGGGVPAPGSVVHVAFDAAAADDGGLSMRILP